MATRTITLLAAALAGALAGAPARAADTLLVANAPMTR
jgi:hypothetical protein